VTDLYWPGDERADDLMTPRAWLRAMVAVEQAWLDTLADAGIAPASTPLDGLVEVDEVAAGAESGGNPVIGLVTLLRQRAEGPAASWVHRGLTSQDVVDTALMLCLRDASKRLRAELRAQVRTLTAMADTHRDTITTGRTLTQPAVPTTFGLKAAAWLTCVLDAAQRIATVTFPAQIGGAAGTLSAASTLAAAPAAVLDLVAGTAERLGLAAASPWHTSRGPVTAIGDALGACTDAWGKIATDVLTLSRPEIAEIAEPAGRGSSSTMPHKRNPVLSTLVRRAAITAPPLVGTLHYAAALAEDERATGPWHAEWSTLALLGRRTVVAASQTTELLAGLHIDTDRMAATARTRWADLTAERDAIAAFAASADSAGSASSAGIADDDYLGVTGPLIDAALLRAATWLEDSP
jgi:3-carboxy-cis,cis-muconate cycloisomerase